MLSKRIIACLDVRNGQVVKGVNFEGLRNAGDPAELAVRHLFAADRVEDPHSRPRRRDLAARRSRLA